MSKKDIHHLLVQQLAAELEAITAAAKASISTATSDAHHAEGKYDTFSLETSYLARGQAKRVLELREALERLQQLPQKALGSDAPVQLGALVRLKEQDGEKRCLFFASAGGGEKITVDDEEIVTITSQSPLGRAILGRKAGERIEISIAGKNQILTVTSIE